MSLVVAAGCPCWPHHLGMDAMTRIAAKPIASIAGRACGPILQRKRRREALHVGVVSARLEEI